MFGLHNVLLSRVGLFSDLDCFRVCWVGVLLTGAGVFRLVVKLETRWKHRLQSPTLQPITTTRRARSRRRRWRPCQGIRRAFSWAMFRKTRAFAPIDRCWNLAL